MLRAIRIPVFNGPAGWNALLPALAPRARLEGEAEYDIAIVGGGFAGLSAARRLHQIDPALRVVILDATRIAEGGTGRNSGFMIDLPHELTSGDYAAGGAGRDRALTRLNARERHIVLERKVRGDGRTLESLATELGLSKERVRQLECAAFAKLRRAIETDAPEVLSLL